MHVYLCVHGNNPDTLNGAVKYVFVSFSFMNYSRSSSSFIFVVYSRLTRAYAVRVSARPWLDSLTHAFLSPWWPLLVHTDKEQELQVWVFGLDLPWILNYSLGSSQFTEWKRAPGVILMKSIKNWTYSSSSMVRLLPSSSGRPPPLTKNSKPVNLFCFIFH